MELYQIRSFIAVADALNLTRAARETHQSPSAVSSQIKALETGLGVTLFKRGPKGMSLTPDGETLLASARTLDQAARDMLKKAGNLRRSPAGNLNIGINTDPSYLNLSGLTRWIGRAMPEVSLTYIEAKTYTTPAMLGRGNIDIGFHFGEFKEPGIFSETFSQARIRVILPASLGPEFKHASLAGLVTLPWIWTRQACPFHRAFQKRLDRKGLSLKAMADAVDENIVEELVKSGTGAALMREDHAIKLVDRGRAVFWDDPGMEIPLAMACLRHRKDEKAVSAFFRAVQQFKGIPLSCEHPR
ncbi:MAG: LysR family transcriptional regulator [Desulfobacterales bacterium]|nr:LysR family transcriptional regulator [Desulfobacterales bacterium]